MHALQVKGAKRALLLSGTPLESRPYELWHQVDALTRPHFAAAAAQEQQVRYTLPYTRPSCANHAACASLTIADIYLHKRLKILSEDDNLERTAHAAGAGWQQKRA